MFDKSLTDILKLAEKWGVEYKLNSDTPGFFVKDNNGLRKKTTIEELLRINDSQDEIKSKTIDITISKALEKPKKKIRINEPRLGYVYFTLSEIDEVCRRVS